MNKKNYIREFFKSQLKLLHLVLVCSLPFLSVSSLNFLLFFFFKGFATSFHNSDLIFHSAMFALLNCSAKYNPSNGARPLKALLNKQNFKANINSDNQ